jgi:hypothetical protein
VRRRGPGTVSRAFQCRATIVPRHERPRWGLGGWRGRLTHWSQPGGGTSSSGISSTAARLSSVGAGAGGTNGVVTAVVAAADGAATAC